MTAREIRQLTRFENSDAFLEARKSQWQPNSRPLRLQGELKTTIERIRDYAARQASQTNASGAGTATKAALIEELSADIQLVVSTAEQIAKEEKKPAIERDFPAPDSRADERIIAIATDFWDKHATYATQWEEHGLDADFWADWKGDLDEYPAAAQGQSGAREGRIDSREDLGAAVETGQEIIKALSVYFANIYRNDKKSLDKWKEASRLERDPVRNKTSPSASSV